MNRIARMTGTVAGVGYLRPAPGTWGSLAALPLAALIQMIGGFPLMLAACVVTFLAGWWATREMTRGQDNHDPSEIVMDEVCGQLIALLPLSFGAWHAGVAMTAMWPGWIAAFVLFRLFDIAKPGPVGWADRRNDPLGVMLDDVIAGVFAALGVGFLAWLAHGVFGV
jgi:phosphatidylglycerophosphatase A